MGLQSIDAAGNLTWSCHNAECAQLSANVSHELVAHVQADVVSLPPCPCGAQTFLKVRFSDAELAAPNMVDKNGRPTPSYAMAQRHIQLRQQLDTAGKAYVALNGKLDEKGAA